MGGRGASSATATARTLPKLGAHVKTALSTLASAPAGYSVSVNMIEDGGAVEVHANVHTTAGKFAGEFGVTFTREGGKLIAKTDNLLMESEHQGKGVGAAIGRNMESAYRQLGVSEVRLHASQVGRYVWARQGYEWSPSTGKTMETAFRGWLSRNGHNPSEASVALHGAKALAESKHGKAFLLSEDAPNWHGSKKL